MRATSSTNPRISSGSPAMAAGADKNGDFGCGGCSCCFASVRSRTDATFVISEHPSEVLAGVQDTFDLAMMPFDANGRNLSLIFSAENANVLRVLRYYDLIMQFCQHARAEAGLGCRFAALG